MHGWYNGWGPQGYGYGFPWGGLLMLALLAAVVVLIAVVAYRTGRSRKPDIEIAKERGIDILIQRFTRGEIDTETFKTLKAEIDTTT